jgi:hypothetical protein
MPISIGRHSPIENKYELYLIPFEPVRINKSHLRE